jgi:hypothetical protein
MQVNNHPLSIRVLLEAGANMDAVDDRGITALHLAASAGHVLVMQHLLVCGVNVDRTDVHGSAPLHYAVTMQQHAAVQLLVIAGADQELVNHQGYSALNSPIYGAGGIGARAAGGQGHGKMTVPPATVNSMNGGLAQIKEADSDVSGSVFGAGPPSARASSSSAADTGTVVSVGSARMLSSKGLSVSSSLGTGTGVEVKKWKFADVSLGGREEEKMAQGADADKAYLAFNAASGVPGVQEDLLQLDAVAQLESYLDGMVSGPPSAYSHSTARSLAPSTVGTHVTGMTKTGAVVGETDSSVGSVFTALESQVVDWDDAMSSVSNQYLHEDTTGINIDAHRQSESEPKAAIPTCGNGWLAALQQKRLQLQGPNQAKPAAAAAAAAAVEEKKENVSYETVLARQQLDDYLDNLNESNSCLDGYHDHLSVAGSTRSEMTAMTSASAAPSGKFSTVPSMSSTALPTAARPSVASSSEAGGSTWTRHERDNDPVRRLYVALASPCMCWRIVCGSSALVSRPLISVTLSLSPKP